MAMRVGVAKGRLDASAMPPLAPARDCRRAGRRHAGDHRAAGGVEAARRFPDGPAREVLRLVDAEPELGRS